MENNIENHVQNPFYDITLFFRCPKAMFKTKQELKKYLVSKNMGQSTSFDHPFDPFSWYVRQTQPRGEQKGQVIDTIIRQSTLLEGFEDVIEISLRDRRILKKSECLV